MSTSGANSNTGSPPAAVGTIYANHGTVAAQDESKNRVELVTSGFTPEFIQVAKCEIFIIIMLLFENFLLLLNRSRFSNNITANYFSGRRKRPYWQKAHSR
jgi:hypothetical protein